MVNENLDRAYAEFSRLYGLSMFNPSQELITARQNALEYFVSLCKNTRKPA